MHFAKNHKKKGPKKMQANNAKAVSTCARAIKALAKPRSSPRSQRVAAANSVDLPTLLTPSMGNVLLPALPEVSVLESNAKFQTTPQAMTAAAAQTQAEV
ncbi:60S ribosomal protein L29-like [Pteronotus mesoamericanus]|uniref:60S ribosomal protein L29-like n=1 Tax=Pteronotus mesoamericanus TaxID=1884717 RepID=UPI0023EE1EAB|nr:60S ribosomal protein L29-like [Pteronotus parnellii mesoamericanus]